MGTALRLTYTLAILLATTACSGSGIGNRYCKTNGACSTDAVPSTAFRATVFQLPLSQGSEKSIFELTNRGQAALIAGLLGESTKNWWETLAQGIKEARATLPPNDSTTSKVRLVIGQIHSPVDFSIPENKGLDPPTGAKKLKVRPADRLEWTESRLCLTQPEEGGTDLRFVDYDRVATSFEVIELGKVSRSTTHQASVNAKVGTLDGESSKPGAGVEAGTTATTSSELALRKRRLALAVAIIEEGRCLEIVRQGEYGVDLSDALVVDVSVRSISNGIEWVTVLDRLVPAKPDAEQSDSPKYEAHRFRKHEASAVPIHLETKGIVRHVVDGDDTYAEYDDEVCWQTLNASSSNLKVTLSHPSRFSIQYKSLHPNGAKIPLRYHLIDRESGAAISAEQFNVEFLTEGRAKQFVEDIKGQAEKEKDRPFRLQSKDKVDMEFVQDTGVPFPGDHKLSLSVEPL